MEGEAWVDYLAHPGLLAATVTPMLPSTATDRYVSLLSSLRCVIAEANAMTIESVASNKREEELKVEIGRCQETINKQNQLLREQEDALRVLERHCKDCDKAVKKAFQISQIVNETLDEAEQQGLALRAVFRTTGPSNVADLNEARLRILKDS